MAAMIRLGRGDLNWNEICLHARVIRAISIISMPAVHRGT